MEIEVATVFNTEDIRNVVEDVENWGTDEEILVFENTRISMKEFSQYAGSSFYIDKRNEQGDVIVKYGKYLITLPEASISSVGVVIE